MGSNFKVIFIKIHICMSRKQYTRLKETQSQTQKK